MNVTHDLIAAVSGPGWKYGLSRILINSEEEGVVFIAGADDPIATFAVKDIRSNRGTGVSEDGEIIWRRRGSSCQYKLAKCKVSTEQMTERWEASLTPAEPETVLLPGDEEPVPTGTAAEILAWVGDDSARAEAALDIERAKDKPRVGLTGELEKIVAVEELL